LRKKREIKGHFQFWHFEASISDSSFRPIPSKEDTFYEKYSAIVLRMKLVRYLGILEGLAKRLVQLFTSSGAVVYGYSEVAGVLN